MLDKSQELVLDSDSQILLRGFLSHCNDLGALFVYFVVDGFCFRGRFHDVTREWMQNAAKYPRP